MTAPAEIPLCVPFWDESEALRVGAKYTPEKGFYLPAKGDRDAVWAWLPWRWRPDKHPALWPEMLPQTTWEENLRAKISTDRWDAIRRHAYKAAGYRCEICGSKGVPHLEAHERWEWDDTWCVQKLVGVVALCPPCHKVMHSGLAKRLGLWDAVLAKMQEVNGWTLAQTLQALDTAKKQAEERSRYGWVVDLSWLETGEYHLVYKLEGSRF